MSLRPVYLPDGMKVAKGWKQSNPMSAPVRVARSRIFVVAIGFILAFAVTAIRLMEVTVLSSVDDMAGVNHAYSNQSKTLRANIVDRNGEVLATSIRTFSLYANSKVVIDADESAKKLMKVLPNLKAKDLTARLKSDKSFVWLARHLTPQQQADVIRLGIPGVYLQKDERRVYPHGELFAHVLGFTDIDNQGISGVEKSSEHDLLANSEPLYLSFDLRAQHILKEELEKSVDKFKAQGAAGMIYNIKTGEIVAMVSLPDFDPNQVGEFKGKQEAMFNRNTLGVYEMGSTMKIINTAMALDSGSVNLSQEFDVTRPLQVGRFKITDYHASNHWMNAAEIFVKSSNIGSAKIALQAGSTKQRAFFEKLGLFKHPSLELPEVGSPILPKSWGEATTITASYGYGISISPLQAMTAVAGIVNNGNMVQPTILKRKDDNFKTVNVLSPKVSGVMRELLRLVVAEGTGKKAAVPGYEVGGKTGTANTVQGRGYKKGENTTSFIGCFPMRDPQYLVMIMVDRPQGIKETYGFNAGGWNAAPTAGNVIKRIAPVMGVRPVADTGQPTQNPMMLNVSIRR